MTNWLLMFRPDTYEIVQAKGVIGALYMDRRRFGELREWDRVIAYVSKEQIIDGYGRLTSGPYEDPAPLFPGNGPYPERCRVAFEQVGARMPGADLLWKLDVWAARAEPLKTTPWNMLYCYGGFMKIPDSDYDRMVSLIDGARSPHGSPRGAAQ